MSDLAPAPLDPVVTAPDFGTDPLGYYCWHLTHHPEMYVAFRRHTDLYRAVDLTRRVSADMICHVLRYHTGLHATDDRFSVNNVLTALYARLYRHERPGANIAIRASQLDALSADEWVDLLALLPQEVPSDAV